MHDDFDYWKDQKRVILGEPVLKPASTRSFLAKPPSPTPIMMTDYERLAEQIRAEKRWNRWYFIGMCIYAAIIIFYSLGIVFSG